MSAADTSSPVSLENSMLGLSLIEGMLDPEKEQTYELLLDQHSPEELVDLMLQFGLQWLAYESRLHEVPMVEYLGQLRLNFLAHAQAMSDDARG